MEEVAVTSHRRKPKYVPRAAKTQFLLNIVAHYGLIKEAYTQDIALTGCIFFCTLSFFRISKNMHAASFS